MKRPGLGSAVVRLIAVFNAGFWLLGIPEFLDVWGKPDGYTVPAEIALPRATIWIVAAMMVATVGLLFVGWWQRRTRAVAPRVRTAAWVVAGMQLAWAVLLIWSTVLSLTAYNASGDFNSDGGIYFEGFLAVLSILSALPLVRDALATSAPPPRPVRSARVGVGSAVLRACLMAGFVGLIAALPAYLVGWNDEAAPYASGPTNVPWGPFLCAVVFGLTVVMLPLGWWWRRHSTAPARGLFWLRAAAALEALWASLVVIKIVLDPSGLTRQVALRFTDELAMVALATVGGIAAWLHDRDARRCQGLVDTGGSEATGSPEPAGPQAPVKSDVYLGG